MCVLFMQESDDGLPSQIIVAQFQLARLHDSTMSENGSRGNNNTYGSGGFAARRLLIRATLISGLNYMLFINTSPRIYSSLATAAELGEVGTFGAVETRCPWHRCCYLFKVRWSALFGPSCVLRERPANLGNREENRLPVRCRCQRAKRDLEAKRPVALI